MKGKLFIVVCLLVLMNIIVSYRVSILENLVKSLTLVRNGEIYLNGNKTLLKMPESWVEKQEK